MKMYASIVNLVLLSTLLVVYGEPQFRRYLAPYPPIFRDYPDALQPANLENPARFIFIETTSYTTVVVTSTKNCRYSTAVLAACRRRRSVEEDAYAIAPSAVTRFIFLLSVAFLAKTTLIPHYLKSGVIHCLTEAKTEKKSQKLKENF